MRKGQNPAEAVNEVVKPKRITVLALNYIPFVSGFFAEMRLSLFIQALVLEIWRREMSAQ